MHQMRNVDPNAHIDTTVGGATKPTHVLPAPALGQVPVPGQAGAARAPSATRMGSASRAALAYHQHGHQIGSSPRAPSDSTVSRSFAGPTKPMTLAEFQRSLAALPPSSVNDETIIRTMSQLNSAVYAKVAPLFEERSSMAAFLQDVARLKDGSSFRGFELSLEAFKNKVIDELALVPSAENDIAELITKMGPCGRAAVQPLWDSRSSINGFLNDIKALKLPSRHLAFTPESGYLGQVFDHLMEQEHNVIRKPVFGPHQLEITHRMRGILIDWLVEVALRFNFHDETLFLAVIYTDRYLMEHAVPRVELQLVGIASLMLAAKYEEIYPPQLNEFVFVTANAYQKDELIRMERQIFMSMGYKVTVPTTIMLAKCLSAVQDPPVTEVQTHLTNYILFTLLVSFTLDDHPLINVAAAATYVARRWCGVETPDPPAEIFDLVPSVVAELNIVNNGPRLHAIRNRFSSSKYLKVSAMPLPSIDMSTGTPVLISYGTNVPAAAYAAPPPSDQQH